MSFYNVLTLSLALGLVTSLPTAPQDHTAGTFRPAADEQVLLAPAQASRGNALHRNPQSAITVSRAEPTRLMVPDLSAATAHPPKKTLAPTPTVFSDHITAGSAAERPCTSCATCTPFTMSGGHTIDYAAVTPSGASTGDSAYSPYRTWAAEHAVATHVLDMLDPGVFGWDVANIKCEQKCELTVSSGFWVGWGKDLFVNNATCVCYDDVIDGWGFDIAPHVNESYWGAFNAICNASARPS